MRIDDDPDPAFTADEVVLERTAERLVLTVLGDKPSLNVRPMRSLRDRIEPLLKKLGIKAEEISLLVTPDAGGLLILPHDRWDSLEEIRGNPVIDGSGHHPKLLMSKLKVIAGDVSIFNGTRVSLPVLREVQGDLLVGHDVEIPGLMLVGGSLNTGENSRFDSLVAIGGYAQNLGPAPNLEVVGETLMGVVGPDEGVRTNVGLAEAVAVGRRAIAMAAMFVEARDIGAQMAQQPDGNLSEGLGL